MEKLLEIKALKKSYNKERLVLKDIDLELFRGERIAVLGPSGCGKTTLLNHIAGLLPYDQGEIRFSSSELQISYMPQHDCLFPWNTILDNVALPLKIKGVPRQKARQQAGAFLEDFGLKGCEDLYPSQLSGGMRQRAAVLRTFLNQGDIWLLDEPLVSLDIITRRKMQAWLLKVWEKYEASVLFITHDIDEALLWADRIYLLSGSPAQVKKVMEVNFSCSRDMNILAKTEFNRYKEELYAQI